MKILRAASVEDVLAGAPPLREVEVTKSVLIESVSEADMARLLTVRDEAWTRATTTDVTDWSRAEKAIAGLYAEAGLQMPAFVLHAPPATCILARRVLAGTEGDSLWASLGSSLKSSLESSLWASLGASLESSLWASLGASLSEYFWGNMEFGWITFYRACGTLPLAQPYDAVSARRLELWREIAESCGWWWPYQHAVLIGDRPSELHWSHPLGVLHRDGGPAVAYRDGWKIWALHGVQVPQWLAETKAEAIDCAEFAKVANVEVRREFVRKVGIERIAQKLGAETLDKRGDYELLLVDLKGDTGKWPYLKMVNPSIGVWHLECVDRACRTVQQAINFRAGKLGALKGDWVPEVLT